MYRLKVEAKRLAGRGPERALEETLLQTKGWGIGEGGTEWGSQQDTNNTGDKGLGGQEGEGRGEQRGNKVRCYTRMHLHWILQESRIAESP